MNTGKRRPAAATAAVFFTILTCLVSPPGMAEETVYPHWTGRHCTECHVEGKIPELRFGGDVVQVCNRCHQAAPPCSTVHVRSAEPADASAVSIPADWPPGEGKITCLTCHAAPLQMYADAAGEKDRNLYFLRSGEKGTGVYRFCFNCHREQMFQRINPHEGSPDAGGQLFCFRCHTADLTTGFETCFNAALKTRSSALCTGCHWQATASGHVVHHNLPPDALKAHEDALRMLEEEGLELPLSGGRLHCATCHNPHPVGIIGRKEAAIGAGEKFFLRIPENRVLCAVCHRDKPVDEYIKRFTND